MEDYRLRVGQTQYLGPYEFAFTLRWEGEDGAWETVDASHLEDALRLVLPPTWWRWAPRGDWHTCLFRTPWPEVTVERFLRVLFLRHRALRVDALNYRLLEKLAALSRAEFEEQELAEEVLSALALEVPAPGEV